MTASRLTQFGLGTLYALGFLVVLGCGSSGPKKVPVSGQVSLDGKPFSGGVVTFVPNPAKGNNNRISALGPVQNGNYNLRTLAIVASETGSGAPLGWYKVVLDTSIGGENLKIAPRFVSERDTPISIEVVENPAPGAYDIKFTSK